MSLLLFLACPDPPLGSVEEPLYSGDWEQPTREMVSGLQLPTNDQGEQVLVAGPDASVVYDPASRSPSSAAMECAALVVACLAPERNVLGCLQNVPVCESETPWTGQDPYCCHSSCPDRYVELREAGRIEADALTQAIFGPQACSPGVDDALEGTR